MRKTKAKSKGKKPHNRKKSTYGPKIHKDAHIYKKTNFFI